MTSKIYAHHPKEVVLSYEIPTHLQGIVDEEKQREADLELLDEELKEHGSSLEEKLSSKIIWRMGFPGMILDVQRISPGDSVKLTLKPIHPHRADLAYKNDTTLSRNVSPLTVNALLESREGNFVLGIRGGAVETGKIAIVPGGHADYTIPQIENALETFRSEFREELGYEFDSQEVSPIGVFTNRDTNGLTILYAAKTHCYFPKILENWALAKDREEHGSLFQASRQEIQQLAETGKLTLEGKEYSTTPLFQDCFRLILEK
ncbi:MAG: hypothetical protein ABIB43_03900 [archaeon]